LNRLIQVEVIKPARLNGVDLQIGEMVEIPERLFPMWIAQGYAKSVNTTVAQPKVKQTVETDDGSEEKDALGISEGVDENGTETDNATSNGTGESDGSESPSEN